MKTALYPGTFDPITYGHLDVIERASQLFDHLYIVIAINSKKTPLFTTEERIELAKKSVVHLKNVSVVSHNGLLIDYAKSIHATAIVRGIRAVTDFEYELQIAQMNRKLEPTISTIFLMPNEKYSYLNSSIVRELARYHQNVDEFVSPFVSEALRQKNKEV
jgi:pantetheine-phosphate adenylyltransferase